MSNNLEDKSKKKALRESLLERVASGDPEIIHKVSRETSDIVVLRAIAKNENTAPLTLKILATVNNKSLRARICKNANTPYRSLKMLEDLGYEVPEEVLGEAAKTELSLRKGIEYAEELPGIYAQQILKTL